MKAKDFIQDLKRLESELQHLPKDVAVLAADEFDLNFARESFFGRVWQASDYVKKTRSGGKLLQHTGKLRKSIKHKVQGSRIEFYSNLDYANIHNEGGTVKHPGGTAYFKKKGETIWVSNRKAAGKNYRRTKAHNIKIPQRQFIGEHPELDKMIENEVYEIFKSVFK